MSKKLLLERIKSELLAQKEAKLLRKPNTIEKKEGSRIYIDGQSYINFSSNDYLGLAQCKTLRSELEESVKQCAIGGTSSRLIAANEQSLLETENQVASFFDYETSIHFPSGYIANLAVISTLFKKGDCIFYDKEIHASMAKGIQLSGAKMYGFNHNDTEHLKKRLETTESPAGSLRGLLIESCYSMSGDTPSFAEIKKIAKEYDLITIVDEAHSAGALGPNGKGLSAQHKFKPDILVCTLGKAFGYAGAFLCMSNKLKEYFYNFCSPLIYTTAAPPFEAPYLSKLFTHMERLDALRDLLGRKTILAHQSFRFEEIPIQGSHHIISIPIGNEEKCLKLAEKLKKEGYLVGAVRYPTVAHGKALIRIGITLSHENEDIINLTKTIKKHLTTL